MINAARAYDRMERRTAKNAPAYQFMRLGYFCFDNRDCSAEHLVFIEVFP
jgi:glutaminyl-tRNA synthetase